MNIFQILIIVLSLIIIFLVMQLFILRKNLKMRINCLEGNLKSLDSTVNKLILKEKTSNKLLDLIVGSIPYGVIVLDRQLKILKINESIASMFYLDKDTVTGLKTILVFNNKNLEDLISLALLEGEPKRKEIIFYGEEDKNIEVDAIPVNFENHSLLLLLRNTTQEVEFSRLRSQFVANVSHEMRTPLTSIRGYLETIVENGYEDKNILEKYIPRTLEEVERMYVLIEDLLNLSSIENKRNLLIKQDHDIVPVINDCIESLDFLARKNEIKISFNHPAGPVKMLTDEELLRQLIRNMIENSIFHGGKGVKINIDLQRASQDIILVFSDNGPGIEKKDIPYIFQRFYRIKSAQSSMRAGSGLGLSIVKHITELHKGFIEVSSIPGIETKFKFIFPL